MSRWLGVTMGVLAFGAAIGSFVTGSHGAVTFVLAVLGVLVLLVTPWGGDD